MVGIDYMLAVLWVLILCRFVGWHHHFKLTWCFHIYSDRIKSRDTVQWLRGGIGSLTKACCKECGKPQHPGNSVWYETTGTVEWYACDDDDDDNNNNNNNDDDDDNDNSWASTWYKREWVKCVWIYIHTALFQAPVGRKWKVRIYEGTGMAVFIQRGKNIPSLDNAICLLSFRKWIRE